jgi:nucleotide-binding universal stress UspA family protein
MFKHLLVPLDGSHLSETALPAAAYLAHVMNASVMLIHIIEHNAPKEVHSERHLTDPQEAEAYLEEIARRAFPPEIKVEMHVHSSEVSRIAPSIVEHAEEMHDDLVVMCTHGKGGVRDWIYGSIAQQVTGMKKTPVFLIRPNPNEESRDYQIRKILVPLDRIPEHEQGLPLAIDLAKACGADLHLVMVVPTFGTLDGERKAASRLMPAATAVALNMVELEAEDYLKAILVKLQESGITITTEVRRGDPAASVVDAAEEAGADLIILGTHGKAGMDAFWSGSVAPKISSRSSVPLLLVPIAGEETK